MDFRVVGNGHRQSLHLYMALAGDSVEELVKPERKADTQLFGMLFLM